MQKLVFKIGDKVQYVLTDKPLFTGTVKQIDKRKGFKPYIIEAEDGTTKYANPEYLKKV